MSGKELEQTIRRIIKEEVGASDDLLTIGDAARLGRYSPSTIREWLATGRLRRYGKGRATRINRKDFFEFLRQLGSESEAKSASEVADEILRRQQ